METLFLRLEKLYKCTENTFQIHICMCVCLFLLPMPVIEFVFVFVHTNMCLFHFYFSNSRCLQIYNRLKSIESRLTKMMMETIFLYIIGQYSYYECRVYAMNKTFRVRVRRSPPRCCLFFLKFQQFKLIISTVIVHCLLCCWLFLLSYLQFYVLKELN